MTSNITVAFDILLEEIENAIDELTQEGTHAFQTKDLTTAGRLAEKGQAVYRISARDSRFAGKMEQHCFGCEYSRATACHKPICRRDKN